MNSLEAISREVVETALRKGVTLATAESLTAGMISATLAEVPGASGTLLGGVVSYDARIKQELLSVAQSVIDGDGVISEPCARQMALGAKELLKADIAVSATGLAGPGGGTREIPVGTVFLGVCTGDGETQVFQKHFSGNRQAVRRKTTLAALEMIFKALEILPDRE